MSRALLLALVLAMASGCAHYRSGSLLPEKYERIRLGKVMNRTRAAELAAVARQQLAAELVRSGELVLDRGSPDLILDVRLVGTHDVRRGATRVAEEVDGQDIYRTTIFALELTAEYTLRTPGGKTVMGPELVVGEAIYNEQADLTVVRREGLREATTDAARKIVAHITEDW